MNAAYYNEIDPYAAQWLRNLIAAGNIPAGDVDERSVELVRPDDLRPYHQCHFFAGIGGWAYALRLAGWDDARPVWTGSCPCQPFSAAGKGAAADDERHLWPAWFSLIRECRPARIFGEQVEAAIGWGWLDAVFADLEAEGYACVSAVLPACSVGAPHIRQRLWFVADAVSAEWPEGRPVAGNRQIASMRGNGELALAESQYDRSRNTGARWWAEFANGGELGDAQSQNGKISILARQSRQGGLESRGPSGISDDGISSSGLANHSPWADLVWLSCSDGKARPTQPGLFPLAHGISARVGKLRAAGNAIVPQVAAEFIRAAG